MFLENKPSTYMSCPLTLQWVDRKKMGRQPLYLMEKSQDKEDFLFIFMKILEKK